LRKKRETLKKEDLGEVLSKQEGVLKKTKRKKSHQTASNIGERRGFRGKV